MKQTHWQLIGDSSVQHSAMKIFFFFPAFSRPAKPDLCLLIDLQSKNKSVKGREIRHERKLIKEKEEDEKYTNEQTSRSFIGRKGLSTDGWPDEVVEGIPARPGHRQPRRPPRRQGWEHAKPESGSSASGQSAPNFPH